MPIESGGNYMPRINKPKIEVQLTDTRHAPCAAVGALLYNIV